MLPQFENTDIAFAPKSTPDLLRAKWLFTTMGSPALTNVGMQLTNLALKIGLPIQPIIRGTIYKQFCGGETIEGAAKTASFLHQYGIGVILDYGVEGKEGEAEFDRAVPEFIKAIEFAATQKNIPFISIKVTGFARFALLEKIHSGETLSPAEQSDWALVRQRIDRICAVAAQRRIMVLIDAEETWIQHAVNQLANDMMMAYNTQEAIVYNTFQMYAHASLAYLKESLEVAIEKGFVLGAKLVRGAYMEKERARAAQMNYPSPIQPDKTTTDKDYDAAVLLCLQNLDHTAVFIGTHNEHSCLVAARYMVEHGLSPAHKRVHFSQLYGMSDNISFNLAHSGYHVAKYLPYGPVKDVIPYLMRRAQENTSVAGQTGRELSLINKELQRRKNKKGQ
jgi:proline dehydrogenase